MKYEDTGNTESAYSPWSGFNVLAVPDIGQPYEGGFFGGQVNVGGTVYNLIIAPADQGQDNSMKYKVDGTWTGTTALLGTDYGKENQDTALSFSADTGTFPAFEWADALTINGQVDWYIPAVYELMLFYNNFKPGTEPTGGNDQNLGPNPAGYNPILIPPSTGYSFASSNGNYPTPAQSLLSEWQTGGSEAFSTGFYYSASTGREGQGGTGTNYGIEFNTGRLLDVTKSQPQNVRAIRRVAA